MPDLLSEQIGIRCAIGSGDKMGSIKAILASVACKYTWSCIRRGRRLIVAYCHQHPFSFKSSEAHRMQTEWRQQLSTMFVGFKRLDKLPHGSG
jgi:hypothetical protein